MGLVPFVGEERFGLGRQFHFQTGLPGQASLQFAYLNADDLPDVVAVQGMEDDDFLQPVDEFGAEMGTHRVHHVRSHLLVPGRIVTPDELRPDIGGHDDHGVPEIHRASLPVREPSVVEDLQQHVEHVGMGFLDLVQQHDLVGPAPHCLGQLAAFFVTHVTRRSPDEPCDGMTLHVLRHVDTYHRVAVVEEKLAQGTGQFGLAHAGGSKKKEGADGPVSVAQSGTVSPDSVGNGDDGFILAHHLPVQARLHPDQLLDFAFDQAVDRNPGPLGNDLGYVLLVHFLLEHPAFLL